MLPLLVIAGSALTTYGSIKWAKRKQSLPQKVEPEAKKPDLTKVNRNFAIASTTFGLAVGGIFYPALKVASIAGLFFLTIPIWKQGYRALYRQHRFNIDVVNSLALPLAVVTGFTLPVAFTYWIHHTGKRLIAKTKSYSDPNIADTVNALPNLIWVVKDEVEILVPVAELQVGDVMVVHAGEVIAADGKVISGDGFVDQRALTGQGKSVDVKVGDAVLASTLLLRGKLHIQVERAGDETMMAEINAILSNYTDDNKMVQSTGEAIADRMALPITALSALAFPVIGPHGATAILCTFMTEDIKFITPINTLNHLKIASHSGVLIKDGRALELLSQVDTVIFDKTGTLTQNQLHLSKVYPLANYTEDEILSFAATAEYKQQHPIAKAIQQAAKQRELTTDSIDSSSYALGYGIQVMSKGKLIRVGSFRFMEIEKVDIPYQTVNDIVQACREQNYALVMVSVDDELIGAIELHASLRPEAAPLIKSLQAKGLDVHIFSGDHEKPTQKLAEELNVTHHYAELLPEQKAERIQQLKSEGKKVCFVGDGLNDSIALKAADVSISLHGASPIATDVAQVILMDDSLSQIKPLFSHASELKKNIRFGVLSVLVPGTMVVTGVFFFHLGVLGSVILSDIGLITGLTHSMLPLLKHKKQDNNDDNRN
ncbi:heavy metal translocating P-type ATPase [Candidatus Albibeggiatoa sp. nov. NOAA]|uniref:heavy metal translocating P-type ATPase n=1 Tax=Candidatus Albibeggiatoa sp. nov. NOAA TaxID=3162724 RepID=UPI0032F484D0|nr:heavy metal translocating P-type ATPase [Thiotrichaceae bacterium]